MLRGMLKDKKIYDYSIKSQGKGKKTTIDHNPKGPYSEASRISSGSYIMSDRGVEITGKMTRKNEDARNYKSPEKLTNITKRAFPEKIVQTARIIEPSLDKDQIYKSPQANNYKIHQYIGEYTNTRPTDVFCVLKKRMHQEKEKKKKGDSKMYKSFEFSDEPTEYRNTSTVGKRYFFIFKKKSSSLQ
jgi:hypothetical protein